MKEDEVINKLEFFKKAIIGLKNELNDDKELIEELSTPSSAIIEENLQSRIEELEKINFDLKQELDAIKENSDKYKEKYNKLKKQTYNTIKHLVEDVIEPKEKQMEEINKRVLELENLLFEKNKEHKMVVKSAEKELSEMIAGK
jgi:hypothetical protein